MGTMLQVAMLSGWHVHAKDYARELRAMPDAKITAVWDEEPERGAAWAAELGVPFEADLECCVRREDVQAVVVDAPTNRHPEVMVAAAQAGKHIFTEKVMALKVKECEAIAAAVRAAGVKFCISFPARTTSQFQFVKRAADEGWLGDITLLRVRVAHDGASAQWLPAHFYDPVACGGGAMIDLGAHPMYLARWIMGPPVCVTSTFTSVTGHAIEDNAVAVVRFANKGTAIVETSFVSTHCPNLLELYGTEGTLFAGGPDDNVRIRSNKIDGQIGGWLQPAPLPPALPRPIRIWVEGILEGKPIPFGLDEGLQLTELMEAAYLSHLYGTPWEITRK
jgi:predicted dehydrogenase